MPADRKSTYRAIGLLAAVLALCALPPAPAGALVMTDQATGQKFGIIPVPPRPGSQPPQGRIASSGPTCDTLVDPKCHSLLTYHGGLVQHAQNEILFFWDPTGFASDPAYVTDTQNFVNGLAAGDYGTGHTAGVVGNPISVAQQYYDRSGANHAKRFVPYAVRNVRTVMDTHAFPASACGDSYTDYRTHKLVKLARCLTAHQLQTELLHYIQVHHLPLGINTEYFILTPPGMGSCNDSTSKNCAIKFYCGWHTAAGLVNQPSTQLIYADLPWVGGTNCDIQYLAGIPHQYASGIDSMVGVLSHELAETMTDPDLNGWFGSGGGSDEIGDKCAYQYAVGQLAYGFTGLPLNAGTYYNATFASNDYLLQMEYDNRAGGCNQWDTDPQPAATIKTPASVVHGVSASFSLASVSAPAGVAYVNWNWGDGTTSVSKGLAAASHTYTKAGLVTVSAILTDSHGNEVVESAQVNVG